MYLKYLNFSIMVSIITILYSPSFAQQKNIEQMLMKGFLAEDAGLNFDKQDIIEFSDGITNSDVLPNQKTPQSRNTEDFKTNKKYGENIKTTSTVLEDLSNVEKYYQLLISDKLPIFGHQAFSIPQGSDILYFNTVSKDYKLAPGDVLQVTVRGINPIDRQVQVSQFGNIILPKLIPVNVDGLKLAEVEEKVFNLIKFDDSSAFVNISLEAARLVPVQITGAAKYPQAIAVPAYTPLSRILPLVGGIQSDGSFRNLTVSGASNKIENIDLYGLLRGDIEFNDPLIQSATRVHINDIGLTVGVSGFVGRPAIFELPQKMNKIEATKLLELANAKLIPPGASIEILKLNSDGIIERHKVANIENQTVNAGEVLNVTLPVTSNMNNISVQGAVLKNYEINGDRVKSLAEVLKYGATLNANAFMGFAIIKPKPTTGAPLRSVDLSFAFENPEEVPIFPGERVIIITPAIYQFIMKSKNQRNKLKPTAIESKINSIIPIDKLLRVTEKIYIDNKLSFLIPELPKNSSINTLMNQINLPLNLNYDFALKIEGLDQTNRKITSFSPTQMLKNDDKHDLLTSEEAKTSIKLFSNQYLISTLTLNLNNLTASQGQIVNEELLEAFLEDEEKTKYYKFDQNDRLINEPIEEPKQTFKEALAKAQLEKSEIEFSQPVEIYVDNKLSHIISKNTNFTDSIAFKSLNLDPNIYPFFVRETRIKSSNDRVVPSPRYSSLSDMTDENGQLSKVEMFTHRFVRELLKDDRINLANILEDKETTNEFETRTTDVNQMGLEQFQLNQMSLNQMSLNQMAPNELNQTKELSQNREQGFEHLIAFKRNSKLLSGALEKPGFYPIIGAVTLEDLIAISGGLLPGADLENVTIREYGSDSGKISITGNEYIDVTSIHPGRVILDGRFSVYIPYLVNNADVGSIEIAGEVLHPGTYTFSRNETLEEVLIRAGGFTETAYPLGASFHRESLKDEQRLSNANLAREVEQSILFLSQSQLSGAGDQIKAVVAYANQLKNMPATGKQSLNIENGSKTMLLEDGDKLHIPRRPSHITISGSVQNPVTTVYRPDKMLDEYISDAGGFKRIADKKNVFIMLPDGKNITQSSLKEEGSIIPVGSVIVVPPKTDKLSALGLTDIWSRVLGNIATSILAINAATK